MSEYTIQLLKDTFEAFDRDHSNEISREEALAHWKGKFGKLSAEEFFNQVDSDKNGAIDFDEFQGFFQRVFDSGHSEDEISEVLLSIKNRESWVGFKGQRIGSSDVSRSNTNK